MKMLPLAASPMAGRGNESPIVCHLKALTSAERAERAELGARLRVAIARTDDLDAGYRFHLNADVRLPDLARWAELEHRCCPFFDIALGVERADGSAWFELTGRSGVKAFVRAELTSSHRVASAPEEPSARRRIAAALDGWIANAKSKVVPPASR
jgi:hypothetical protein